MPTPSTAQTTDTPVAIHPAASLFTGQKKSFQKPIQSIDVLEELHLSILKFVEECAQKHQKPCPTLSFDYLAKPQQPTPFALAYLDKITPHLAPIWQEIVQNCIQHGIEEEATRKEKGKNALGTIAVSVLVNATSLEFHVTDDGHGLPLEELLAHGENEALLDIIPTPDQDDLANLIFHPRIANALHKAHADDASGLMRAQNAAREIGFDVVARSLPSSNNQAICFKTVIQPRLTDHD